MHTKNYDHVYVADSGIHGKGLFAAEIIRVDEYIGTYEGIETSDDGIYVLWVFEESATIGRDGTNELRYLNHSQEPNSEFDGYELYALRDIKPDEEITICYDPDDPCHWDDLSV